jgi:hypothetical protein
LPKTGKAEAHCRWLWTRRKMSGIFCKLGATPDIERTQAMLSPGWVAERVLRYSAKEHL